ncbi:MAG: enoyl-ACP reductase [Pirellulales bacterium]|nr:enoyl-ACP reductase [Pirellulales bacterium]
MGRFTGKTGLVMGVASDHSIAWAISQALLAEDARLAFTYLPFQSNERRVRQLLEPLAPDMLVPCDVRKDDDIAQAFATLGQTYDRIDFLLHSIAFAPPDELKKPYVETSRAAWHLAMDASVYSLVATSRAAAPLMTQGGAILTISYFGGEKVIPGYNLMGVCKAALEHSVRYLAWDLGRQAIRVNALSAGPMRTISSAGITGFDELRDYAAHKAPLRRNVEPEDLGRAGVYLLGDDASGVTGEIVHVDCGFNVLGL